MKQLIKRTAGLFIILISPLSLLAQQSVDFQRSAVGQMINGNKIIDFLGSPQFRIVIIIAAIATVVTWAFYFVSMLRMHAEDGNQNNQNQGPLISFPMELFTRGSLGTHHPGSGVPRLMPTEKSEKVGNENKRAKKHDDTQRGE